MAYIGNTPDSFLTGTRSVFKFVATAGQTAFSGADASGITLDLGTLQQNDVYLNGAKIILTDDYTISGETLTLGAAAAAGDILEIVTQTELGNNQAYTKTEAEARYINHTGDVVNGTIQMGGGPGNNITFADNNKIVMGTGNDLEIYHQGADSYIADAGTGALVIKTNELKIQNAAGTQEGMYFVQGGAATLSHNNVARISTTATGVAITGNLDINTNDAAGNTIDIIGDGSTSGSAISTNWTTGSAYLDFRLGGTTNTYTKMRIDNSGNVGIGTNTPDSTLDVSRGTDTTGYSTTGDQRGEATITVRNASETAGTFAGINFYAGAGTGSDWSINNVRTGSYVGDLTFKTRAGGGSSDWRERMRINSSGKVGIGETSPANILHIKTSAGGGPQIELDSTSGTANSGFIGFDGTSLQLSTQRDMVDGSKRDTAKSWGGINIVGAAAGSYIQFQTSEGNNNNAATRMTIQENGNVNDVGYLSSKKGTIQTVVNQPTLYVSINPVQTWAEASSNFRVSITPRFASGTKIFGTFSIPINPTGAANILMSIQPWYSTNGGTTKTVLNQGGPYGSRITGSHAWFRSSNGYDANDMQNHIVHFAHPPGATTTMTWGFYFRSEGSNTTYFCSSSGNSSLWGWTSPVYMELREVEVA